MGFQSVHQGYYFYYLGEVGYEFDELEELDESEDPDGELENDLTGIRAIPQAGGVFRREGAQVAWVCTGTETGQIPVRTEFRRERPANVEAEWEAVAEVSRHIRNGDLRVLDWDRSGGDDRDNLAGAGPEGRRSGGGSPSTAACVAPRS